MDKQKSPSLIFSIYPLTQLYKNRIDNILNSEKAYIDLSTIRKRGLIGAIFYFTRLRAENLYLASESAESEDLLSVLKSFSLISRAKRIYIIDTSFKSVRISRLSILSSLFQILVATLSGLVSLLYARLDMGRYDKDPDEDTYTINGKNILYLNMNLWYGVKVGGSVGHIAGVANELNRKDYQVYYAAISDSASIDPEIKRLLLKSPPAFGLPPEINNYRFDKFNYKSIKQIVAVHRPSFIYQRLSVCSYIGAKIAQKLKIPLIVEYNGSEVWIAKNWGRPLIFEKTAKKAEDVMLKRANVVVTISEVLRNELIERGVDPQKIVYYPNCIDPTIFNPARFSDQEITGLKSQYGLGREMKLITFLGTFGQWHGVDILARSIVELVKTKKEWLDNNNIKFFLVGDGMKMEEVKKILQAGGAEKWCVMTGLVPQNLAPLYLAASDILVSPHVKNPDGTRFFGSPTKLFEYLAMQRPVVASDLEQIGEVLKNSIGVGSGENIKTAGEMKRVACLVEPGNVTELATAIVHLISTPELCKLLAENSRALALREYTWERHVQEILAKLK